jgi:hypothetical protein
MTAKQKLAEQVERFSEQEAEEALLLLGLDSDSEWPDFPPASPRVMEMFRRALVDSEAGRVIPDEDLDETFGFA